MIRRLLSGIWPKRERKRRRAAKNGRTLRFEALERRTLLTVTVNLRVVVTNLPEADSADASVPVVGAKVEMKWQGGGETAYTDANGLATIDLGDDEAGVDFKSAVVTTDGKTPYSVRHNIKEDDYEDYSAEKKFVDPFVEGVNNFRLQIDAKANLQRARAFAIYSALSISQNFANSIGAAVPGPTFVTYPDDTYKPEGASKPLSHAIYSNGNGLIGYTTDALSHPDTIAHTITPSIAA